MLAPCTVNWLIERNLSKLVIIMSEWGVTYNWIYCIVIKSLCWLSSPSITQAVLRCEHYLLLLVTNSCRCSSTKHPKCIPHSILLATSNCAISLEAERAGKRPCGPPTATIVNQKAVLSGRMQMTALWAFQICIHKIWLKLVGWGKWGGP